ncbi:MAG: hypothetical protein O9272_15520 [Brevundimonas sp.]|nr:hypothetical protein [Brevundimonas sp.]
MALAFEQDELVVFSVTNSDLDLQPDPRFEKLITELHGKPNETYDRSLFSAEDVFAREAEVRRRDIPRLIAEAVRFGRVHEVDQVWAVLQGQTLVRMAEGVAFELKLPLKTLIWDPLKWWHEARGIDEETQAIDNALFDRAIRASSFVVAPSWAMAEQITKQYGTASHPIIASIDRSVRQEPATALRQSNNITLAIAGQFYASDAWDALVAALESCDWVCGGQKIVINVYGASSPPGAIDSHKVRLKGWYSQPELVNAIHRECDICYCPYPFAPELRDVSKFSFPSKVVVYLASGRPILFHGPSYSSPGKYLDSRAAGVTCYSRDPKKILTALEQMITDADEYARLAAAGSEAFQEDFTLDVQASLVNAHLRAETSATKIRTKWGRSRTGRDPHAVYRRYFDPFYYWNARREARNFEGGILAHYLAYGWRERTDPHVLFSTSYYLESRPDVDVAGFEPLGHYITLGWQEGTCPHPLFDVSYYLRQRPDVAAAGLEPLAHYLTRGWHEGADPHPLFSAAYYASQRPNLAASGVCPLIDYLTAGWREGADPHPLFSITHYLACRSDVRAAGIEPLTHYLSRGWREGTDPHPLFSTLGYLALRPDAAAANVEPLSHYVQYGWREGVNPHPMVDVAAYRQANPDVEAAGCEPLSHYLHLGWREGRSISPWVDDAAYLSAHPALFEAGCSPLLDCATDGWKHGREPAVWFSSQEYRARNPDVDFSHEAPFVHYVRAGWREGRDPNCWFSITDFERRTGVRLEREPMIDFLHKGLPAPSDTAHFSSVSENFKIRLALRQAARENERLRLASVQAPPLRNLAGLTPQERNLVLIEDILGDVGTHITQHLESGAIHGGRAADLWRLLIDITKVSDRWLRKKLFELDGGTISPPEL